MSVCAVDAIKVSDTDQRRTDISRDVFEFVKNLHGLDGAGAPARVGVKLRNPHNVSESSHPRLCIDSPRARATASRNSNFEF